MSRSQKFETERVLQELCTVSDFTYETDSFPNSDEEEQNIYFHKINFWNFLERVNERLSDS